MENDIINALEEDHIIKSWSTDLSKKHPGGKWVTIRGAKIFVDGGGKIVAGNKELRSKLSGEKKKKETVKLVEGKVKEMEKQPSRGSKVEDEKRARMLEGRKKILTKLKDGKTFAEKKPGKYKSKEEMGKMSLLEVSKYSNVLREKRNKLPKGSPKRPEIQAEIDSADKIKEQKRPKEEAVKRGDDLRAKVLKDMPSGLLEYAKDRLSKLHKRPFDEKNVRDYIANNKISGVAIIQEHARLKGDKAGKEKLSDRAQGIVEGSQKVWDKTPMMEQKKMFEGLEHQLAKHEQAVKDIGMGYDADMVSAAKEFMDKNRSDYDKIIGILRERGALKDQEINALKERGLITEKKKETPKPDKKMLASEKKKNTEARKLSKESLDYESTEGLAKLHKHAAKIDNKYLTAQTKNKITDLVEDIKIELYHADLKGYDDRLKGAETLTEALNVAKQLNAQLAKQDTYTMEEDMFVRTQKLIADALIQQTNKKTTEALQYKLF